MAEFSKKDLSLLYEIQNNARVPINKVAKKLHVSQQGLTYRLKKLQDSKCISQFYTIFDYARFGYHCFKVLLTLDHSKHDQFEALLRTLHEHHAVLSVAECGGKWDLIILFATKSAARLHKELEYLLTRFPEFLRKYTVLMVVATQELGRRYLVEFPLPRAPLIVGGEQEHVKIDTVDQHLMKEFYENPRNSYIHLAAKYHLNPKTVIKKTRALEEKGIIQGYGALLDCSKYNYVAHKMFLRYHHLSLDKEEELLKFLRQQKNVVHISKVLGEWDLVVDTENADAQEFQKFNVHVRSLYGDIIRDMETSQIFQTRKVSYLPQSFFLEVH